MLDIKPILNIIDEYRNTDFWVVGNRNITENEKNILIGGFQNVVDYYGIRPFLVLPLQKHMTYGKIFRGIYLLDAKRVPIGNDYVLVNGIFLRNLEHKTEIEGTQMNLHTYDALMSLLDAEDARQRLTEIEANGCLLIGVCSHPTHFTRGNT